MLSVNETKTESLTKTIAKSLLVIVETKGRTHKNKTKQNKNKKQKTKNKTKKQKNKNKTKTEKTPGKTFLSV